MKLTYHRGDGDYGLRDYVYLWNLLTRASQKVGPIRIVADRSPYEEAFRGWQRLMRKGMRNPRDEFGRGGSGMACTLFLYGSHEMEYYWHGREEVEKALEGIAEAGPEYFARYL